MGEYDIFLSRLEDLALKAREEKDIVFASFVDPSMEILANREIGRYKDLDCTFFGGNVYTERKVICIHAKDIIPNEEDYPISVLQCKKEGEISHQDVLGAVLGLSIKREKIGDINITDSIVQIFVSENISSFIVNELSNISRYDIKFEEVGLEKALVVEPNFKEMNVIVPSLRLDAVIGSAFKLSRNEANMLVKGGKVKINHQVILKPAYSVKVGDMLSVRTKGRGIIHSENGTTKKGNIKLLIKKFM